MHAAHMGSIPTFHSVPEHCQKWFLSAESEVTPEHHLPKNSSNKKTQTSYSMFTFFCSFKSHPETGWKPGTCLVGCRWHLRGQASCSSRVGANSHFSAVSCLPRPPAHLTCQSCPPLLLATCLLASSLLCPPCFVLPRLFSIPLLPSFSSINLCVLLSSAEHGGRGILTATRGFSEASSLPGSLIISSAILSLVGPSLSGGRDRESEKRPNYSSQKELPTYTESGPGHRGGRSVSWFRGP